MYAGAILLDENGRPLSNVTWALRALRPAIADMRRSQRNEMLSSLSPSHNRQSARLRHSSDLLVHWIERCEIVEADRPTGMVSAEACSQPLLTRS